MSTIPRDGDHFVIGTERIPVFTECAGRVLEWVALNHFGLETKPMRHSPLGGEIDLRGGWNVIRHDTTIRVLIRDTADEPSVRDAQRRVVAVLEALTMDLCGLRADE